MRRLLVLPVLFLALNVNAADDGLYFGVNLAQINYKEDGFSTASPKALVLRLGKELNPNVAIEGRIATGISDDTTSGVKIELDGAYGVYFKGIIPGATVSPYGLVGYTNGEITASVPGFSISDDEGDFSYGIGLDFAVSKTFGVNVEFAKLFTGDGYKVDGLSVGATFRF